MNLTNLSHTKVNLKMYAPVIVALMLLVCILYAYGGYSRESEPFVSTPVLGRASTPVYCLMVTGHTPERIAFARQSVSNFLAQTYDNKHLIIINQSRTPILREEYPNMLETYVNNTGKTLGELRNMTLQFVPPDAIWTTWDDDDWRAADYIAHMLSVMTSQGADFFMFQNRIDYNQLNGFAFKATLRSGLMTFFAKHNPYLRYAHVSTSEDKPLKEYAVKQLNTFVYDNDAKLYIRLIHGANTSVYVDKAKSEIRDTRNNRDFFEAELSDDEQKFLDNIISKYYKYV